MAISFFHQSIVSLFITLIFTLRGTSLLVLPAVMKRDKIISCKFMFKASDHREYCQIERVKSSNTYLFRVPPFPLKAQRLWMLSCQLPSSHLTVQRLSVPETPQGIFIPMARCRLVQSHSCAPSSLHCNSALPAQSRCHNPSALPGIASP